MNQTLLVDRIVINLDPDNINRLRFNFLGHAPYVSDNLSQPEVNGKAPDSQNPPNIVDAYQHDNFGFVDWFNTTSPANPSPPLPGGLWPGGPNVTPQITFSPVVGTPEILTIFFHPYYDGGGNLVDAGFSPGDRFRFGVDVERANNAGNWSTANGDDIGDLGVEVTVYFRIPAAARCRRTGAAHQPVSGYRAFLERLHRVQRPGHLAARPPGHVPLVGPSVSQIRESPIRADSARWTCPARKPVLRPTTSSRSPGSPGGGALRNYAVRAQARMPVRLLCSGFCGFHPGPFAVFACATAMYDCELQRPRLIRVERAELHLCRPVISPGITYKGLIMPRTAACRFPVVFGLVVPALLLGQAGCLNTNEGAARPRNSAVRQPSPGPDERTRNREDELKSPLLGTLDDAVEGAADVSRDDFDRSKRSLKEADDILLRIKEQNHQGLQRANDPPRRVVPVPEKVSPSTELPSTSPAPAKEAAPAPGPGAP